MESVAPRQPVLVPFVCPICAASNAIELIRLSRAGGMDCVGCKKHLRSADVMRAMHAPRRDTNAPAPTQRPVAQKSEMVWPPTAESRAAIAPLKRRKDGNMN